jgi:hypothetical protein
MFIAPKFAVPRPRPTRLGARQLAALALLLPALVAGCGGEGEEPVVGAPDRTEWMRSLKGDPLVFSLDLPGSHDSATYKASAGSYYQCQTKTITEQLNLGVRVLDIRLKMSETADKRGFRNLLTAHGTHTYESFSEILQQCANFLARHPSETIVMIVSSEGSYNTTAAPTFNDSVNWYLRQSWANWEQMFPDTSGGKLWGFTLQQAKGKVLLVSRQAKQYEPGWIERAQYVNWSTSGQWNDGLLALVQDEWGEQFKVVGEAKKVKRAAIEGIQVGRESPNPPLVIQHLSASFRQTPYWIASYFYPMFADEMRDFRSRNRLGWFMMDYVGDFADNRVIIDHIITNQPRQPIVLEMPKAVTISGPNPAPDDRRTTLSLGPNEAIVSAGARPRYGLLMQSDNNLVLYHFVDWYEEEYAGTGTHWGKRGFAIWSSGTSGKGEALAHIDNVTGAFQIWLGGQVIWNAFKATPETRKSRLVLQEDGNLVVYVGTKALWATNTRSAPR